MKNKTCQQKKIGAIIQARMGSTRLPGKVLMDIEGKPMLWHVVNRLKLCQKLDDIVLAIPDTKENDVLAEFAQNNNIKYYRGDEQDVLSRYYKATKEFVGDTIVRITADCPLIDPQIVDSIIDSYNGSYVSNVGERTFPRGLDTEVFSFLSLEKAHKEARQDQREHVTTYIRENEEVFNVEARGKLRRPDLRLTVDTKEDLQLIRKIYQELYQDNVFYTGEVIDLLDKRPELININKNIVQKI